MESGYDTRSDNPRCLIAKYIPDLCRNEQRNFGVFLWKNGELSAKFLPPEKVQSIGCRETYERWVNYWAKMISEGRIRLPRGNKYVSNSESECIDALLKTQKGNYVLEESFACQVQSCLDVLFSELVL